MSYILALSIQSAAITVHVIHSCVTVLKPNIKEYKTNICEWELCKLMFEGSLESLFTQLQCCRLWLVPLCWMKKPVWRLKSSALPRKEKLFCSFQGFCRTSWFLSPNTHFGRASSLKFEVFVPVGFKTNTGSLCYRLVNALCFFGNRRNLETENSPALKRGRGLRLWGCAGLVSFLFCSCVRTSRLFSLLDRYSMLLKTKKLRLNDQKVKIKSVKDCLSNFMYNISDTTVWSFTKLWEMMHLTTLKMYWSKTRLVKALFIVCQIQCGLCYFFLYFDIFCLQVLFAQVLRIIPPHQ